MNQKWWLQSLSFIPCDMQWAQEWMMWNGFCDICIVYGLRVCSECILLTCVNFHIYAMNAMTSFVRYTIWCDKLLLSGRNYDANPNRICSVFDFYPPLFFPTSKIYITQIRKCAFCPPQTFRIIYNKQYNEPMHHENILLGAISPPCFSLYGILTIWSNLNGFRHFLFFILAHSFV